MKRNVYLLVFALMCSTSVFADPHVIVKQGNMFKAMLDENVQACLKNEDARFGCEDKAYTTDAEQTKKDLIAIVNRESQAPILGKYRDVIFYTVLMSYFMPESICLNDDGECRAEVLNDGRRANCVQLGWREQECHALDVGTALSYTPEMAKEAELNSRLSDRERYEKELQREEQAMKQLQKIGFKAAELDFGHP